MLKRLNVDYFLYDHPFSKVLICFCSPLMVKVYVIGFVYCLSYLLYETSDFGFIESDTTMFALSVGLVSIVTYISRFLETQISDGYSSEDYYLGVNLKRNIYYENFWLHIFNHFPAKLLFWSIALIPSIILFPKIPVKKLDPYFVDLKELISSHELLLKSVWCSVFAVVSLLCIGVLIESIYLTRKIFSGRRKYSKRLVSNAKRSIRMQVKNEYQNLFYNAFSIRRMNKYVIKTRKRHETGVIFISKIDVKDPESVSEEISIYDIVRDAHNFVGNKPDELNEYFDIVFDAETRVMEMRVKRFLYIKDKGLPLYKKYKTIMLQFVDQYYLDKWGAIALSQSVYFSEVNLIKMAVNDLKILRKIDSTFTIDEEYLNIFWDNTGSRSRQPIFSPWRISLSSVEKMGLYRLISKSDCFHKAITYILIVFHHAFCSPEFIHSLSDDSWLINNFFVELSLFEKTGKQRIVDSDGKLSNCNVRINIFKDYFNTILNEELNDNKARFVFRDLFGDKNSYKDQIVYESTKYLSGDNDISLNSIEYILSFLSISQINALLLFRLAFCGSIRNKMTVTEYKTWKTAISDRLADDDPLCADDIKSISHFFEELSDNPFKDSSFVEWAFNSLNYDVSDEMYDQFNGHKNNNFSFASYVLFRMMYQKMDFGSVSKMRNKKEIKKQLKEIDDVMKYEKLDFKNI